MALDNNTSLQVIPGNSNLARLVQDAEMLDNAFAALEKTAEKLKDSSYGKQFERNNPETGKTEIRTIDIINAMIIGNSIGLNPFDSVAMGKKLNPDSLIAIRTGLDMGIPYSQAMNKIYSVPTSKGNVLIFSVEIYLYLMNIYNVEHKIIKNYEPEYAYYYTSSTIGGLAKSPMIKEELYDLEGKFLPNILVLSSFITGEDVKQHVAKCENLGLKPLTVTRVEIGKITSVRFIRKDKNFDETFSFTTQAAINAGLMKGTTEFGDIITDTKENYGKWAPDMFLARCYSKGCRRAVPERTINSVTADEYTNAEIINDNVIRTDLRDKIADDIEYTEDKATDE